MSEVTINDFLLRKVIAERVLKELELNILISKNEDISYFKDISLYKAMLIESSHEDIFIDYELIFSFPKSFSCLIEGLYSIIPADKALYMPEIILTKIKSPEFKNRDLSLVWLNIILDYLTINLNKNKNESLIVKKKELIQLINDIKNKRFLFKEDPEILNSLINDIIIYKKSLDVKENKDYEFIILNDIAFSFLNAEEIYSFFIKHFENNNNEIDTLYHLFSKHF